MFDASDNANENFYVKIKNKKVNTWHYSVNKKRKEGMVTVSVLLKCLFLNFLKFKLKQIKSQKL